MWYLHCQQQGRWEGLVEEVKMMAVFFVLCLVAAAALAAASSSLPLPRSQTTGECDYSGTFDKGVFQQQRSLSHYMHELIFNLREKGQPLNRQQKMVGLKV